MVQTPVGARCPDHGEAMRDPRVEASSTQVTRAIAAGVGASAALHIAYAYIYAYIILLVTLGTAGIIIGMFGPAAIGYAVGVAVYRAAGYTRNNTLAWIAVGSVVGGFIVVSIVWFQPPVGRFGMLIGMYLAYTRVRP
jgi:hypothetical protein